MTRLLKVVMGVLVAMVASLMAFGQTRDDQRMDQDIEVAENILSTLIRQQYGKRDFFPIEVKGNYMSGYGVTLRMPNGGPFNGMFGLRTIGNVNAPDMIDLIGIPPDGSFSYSYNRVEDDCEDCEKEREPMAKEARERAVQEKQRARATTPKPSSKAKTSLMVNGKKVNSDSLSAVADKKFMEVAKNFLADYGDVLSQLRPEEKIVITNRMEEFGGWYLGHESRRRRVMSAEAKRDDITQLKQGKITREQFLSRLKIINAEPADKLDPDLEVLSSMFSRLYREDLSKSYYTQDEVTYERLKDFGVIYYMRVYSSNQEDDNLWSMPTLAIDKVTQAERDKKVKELYPKFESELKENLIEYGRTLRSLKDEEQVVFNVRLTKCAGCEIPSSIEVSISNSALKDYSSGKTTKEATLAKVNVKKVGNQ